MTAADDPNLSDSVAAVSFGFIVRSGDAAENNQCVGARSIAAASAAVRGHRCRSI